MSSEIETTQQRVKRLKERRDELSKIIVPYRQKAYLEAADELRWIMAELSEIEHPTSNMEVAP